LVDDAHRAAAELAAQLVLADRPERLAHGPCVPPKGEAISFSCAKGSKARAANTLRPAPPRRRWPAGWPYPDRRKKRGWFPPGGRRPPPRSPRTAARASAKAPLKPDAPHLLERRRGALGIVVHALAGRVDLALLEQRGAGDVRRKPLLHVGHVEEQPVERL